MNYLLFQEDHITGITTLYSGTTREAAEKQQHTFSRCGYRCSDIIEVPDSIVLTEDLAILITHLMTAELKQQPGFNHDARAWSEGQKLLYLN